MTEQLMAWFGDYGFPVVPLGGYSSQTLVDSVKADVSASGRPAVLVYAGDFDPTGEDIDRDFAERTDCFAKVIRVAVLPEQVEEYGLTENPGKESDTRSAGFVARHGRNVQVELEALDPAVIRQLYTDAIVGLWDADAYDALLAREGSERAALSRLRERLEHS